MQSFKLFETPNGSGTEELLSLLNFESGYRGGYSWHGLNNIYNMQNIHNFHNIQNTHNQEAGYRSETVGMVGPIFTIYSILRHIALDQKMERG